MSFFPLIPVLLISFSCALFFVLVMISYRLVEGLFR